MFFSCVQKKKHVILTVRLSIFRQKKSEERNVPRTDCDSSLTFICLYLFRFPGLLYNKMDLNYCQSQVCAVCLVVVMSDSETPQTVAH